MSWAKGPPVATASSPPAPPFAGVILWVRPACLFTESECFLCPPFCLMSVARAALQVGKEEEYSVVPWWDPRAKTQAQAQVPLTQERLLT